MSSNATTPAASAATEPSAQPVKVSPKTVATSPAKKPFAAPAKATKKVAAKQAVPTGAKKAVAVQVKPKAVKAEVAQKTVLRPKVASLRVPKIKMVRDSFTFPEAEHKRLVEMKKRLIALGTEVKKGELVRAGLELLAELDNLRLLKAVVDVEKLKTGRPKK